MYRACARCGRIHDSRYVCNEGKIYQSRADRKLRSQYAWTQKSRDIRERANYLCEVCRDQNVYTYENLEVHHIEKLSNEPDKLLDDYNLICLCTEHHKQADAGRIDAVYLKKLARAREDGRI